MSKVGSHTEQLASLLFGEASLGAAYEAAGAIDTSDSSGDSDSDGDGPAAVGTPSTPDAAATMAKRKRTAPAPAWSDDDEEGSSSSSSKTTSSSSSSSSGGHVTTAASGAASGAAAGEDKDMVDISQVARLRKLRAFDGETLISRAEYRKRLRSQFERAHPMPAWAKKSNKRRSGGGAKATGAVGFDDSGSDSDSSGADDSGYGGGGGGGGGAEMDGDGGAATVPTTGALVGRSRTLQPGVLPITRVKDGNAADPSNAVVQSVAFHHSSQLLLAAGFDKTLRLFQVDGRRNAKVQSVFLPDLPIHCAAFNGGTEEVWLSGRRPFFYVYDLGGAAVRKVPRIMGRDEKSLEKFLISPDGRWVVFYGNDGNLIVVAAKTKAWVTNIKMNGAVRAAAFSPDGQRLLSSGEHGEVYVWDVRTWRCIARHIDEGSLGGTAVAVAEQYYAVGSNSGVVNVYGSGSASAHAGGLYAEGTAKPAPLSSLMHLTTPVDLLRFNGDAQILAMASRRKKDSLKIVHLPSFTVFSNWPTTGTPLRYVSAIDISPNSGFLAIGNDRGRVLLYRLNHYGKA